MKRECDKHSINFTGMMPREFVKEFIMTNYSYQKESFRELNKEYKRQSIGDGKRGRPKLSGSLKNLSTACYLFSKKIDKDSGEYKESLKNLNPKKLAETFGYTNYFFQKKCFELMKNKMPLSFILISKSIDDVCNSCKNYLKNPFG